MSREIILYHFHLWLNTHIASFFSTINCIILCTTNIFLQIFSIFIDKKFKEISTHKKLELNNNEKTLKFIKS